MTNLLANVSELYISEQNLGHCHVHNAHAYVFQTSTNALWTTTETAVCTLHVRICQVATSVPVWLDSPGMDFTAQVWFHSCVKYKERINKKKLKNKSSDW